MQSRAREAKTGTRVLPSDADGLRPDTAVRHETLAPASSNGHEPAALPTVVSDVQRIAGNRAAVSVARRRDRPEEQEEREGRESEATGLAGGGAPAPAAEPPTPPQGPPEDTGAGGREAPPAGDGAEGGDVPGSDDDLDRRLERREPPPETTPRSPPPPRRAAPVGDMPQVARQDARITPAAEEAAEPAGQEEVEAAPESGGEIVAPIYRLPQPETAAQQIIHDELAPVAQAEQQRLTAAVNDGITELRDSVRTEREALDTTARTQRRRASGSFGRARGRIREAIRLAIEQVEGAGLDAENELRDWHEQHARPEAERMVGDAQRDTQELGERKGGQAVTLANTKAGEARTRIQGYAREARSRGGRRVAEPGGGSDKVRTARRRAAREFTSETAARITENLADTVSQIRDMGPEVEPQFIDQGIELAERLGDELPGIIAEVDGLRRDATANVAQTVTNNTTSLRALETSYLDNLEAVEGQVLRSLREATRASKQALSQEEETAVRATRAQHDAVAQAGADLVATILARVSDPRIRQDAARRLAGQLAGSLRGGFANTHTLAMAALTQVASTFAEAAAAARAALEEAGTEGAGQAEPIAAAGERAAREQAGELVGQMSQMLMDALSDGDDMLVRAQGRLGDRIGEFERGFDEALRGLTRELDDKVQEAADNARVPLDSFDADIRQAMIRAQEEIEQSWLERQLSSINWGFLAGLIVGILVTIAVIALLGTGIGALILAGALAGALSVLASTATENLVAHLEGREGPGWNNLGRDMAMGALFGAVGGAISGGVGGALGRQVAMSAGRRLAIQVGTDWSSSISLGVVQNLVSGNQWDEGLLVNMVTTVGMTSRIPVGRSRPPPGGGPPQPRTITNPLGAAVEGLTNRARAGAVDRGSAYNVDPTEQAASQARLAERAGVDLPEGGTEGAAPPAERAEGGTPPPPETPTETPGPPARPAGETGGDRPSVPNGSVSAPPSRSTEGSASAPPSRPTEGGAGPARSGETGAEPGARPAGEGAEEAPPGGQESSERPGGPSRNEVEGRPVTGEGDAEPSPPTATEGAAPEPSRPSPSDRRRMIERAGRDRARAERANLEAQQRLEGRFNDAYETRQQRVNDWEARRIEQARERFRQTGDERWLSSDQQDIEARAAAARESNDTWLRDRMQWVDDLTQQRHRQADERYRQRVRQAERGDTTQWPMAGVPPGGELSLRWTEGGAPMYETGRRTGEAGPFEGMSDAQLGSALDAAMGEAVTGEMGGMTRAEMGRREVTPRGGQLEMFEPRPYREALDPALLTPEQRRAMAPAQGELFPTGGTPGYRDPLSPPGPAAYGHPGADPRQGYHGAMGRSGPGGQYHPAEITFVTPDHPTYAVRVGPAGHYVDHIFSTRAEAVAYADRIAQLGPAEIRRLAALPEHWPGGARGNPVDSVRVDEIPPNTLAQRSGIAPQPESAPGQAGTVYPGGGSQIQIPYGELGRGPAAVYTTPVRQPPDAGAAGGGAPPPAPAGGPEQLSLPLPEPQPRGPQQLELPFDGRPEGGPAPTPPPATGGARGAGGAPAVGAATPGGAGLQRPLSGPQGLWAPTESWPATIPSVHIREPRLEEDLPVAPPEPQPPDGSYLARPNLDIPEESSEEAAEDEEAAVSLQRVPDPGASTDAIGAWRLRVRRDQARHAARQAGLRRR